MFSSATLRPAVQPPGAAPLIRKIRRDEAELYARFLLALDPDTRRDRFCGAMSDFAVAAHARRALAAGSIVYGCFLEGRLVGAAEISPAHRGVAEAAFAVELSHQKRGLGGALLDAAVLAARNRGCGTLRVACLPTNKAMQRLARRAQAALTLACDEVQGEIHPPAPTPLSWMRELVADGFDAAIGAIGRPPAAGRAA